MSSPTERRYRELAGTRRTAHFARVKSQERVQRVLRRHWWRFALMTAVHLGATAVLAALVDADLIRGLVIGVGITTALWAATGVLISTAGISPMLSGRDAEAWTAEALAPLLTHGWRLINHVAPAAKGGDHDHVLIGPGGLFVLETKWSAQEWTLHHRELSHACGQAALGAKRFSQLRARKHGVVARPIVVIWGPVADELDEAQGLSHDGVLLLHGSHLKHWSRSQARRSVQPDAVADIASEVATLASYTDARDSRAPRTVDEWLSDAAKIGLFGLAVLFAVAVVAAAHAVAGLLVALVAVALSTVGLRRKNLRPYALAALWASAIFSGLLGVSAVSLLLTD